VFRGRRAALCLLPLLLAGCRTLVPDALPLPADDPRAGALVGRLAASADERRALRGRTRVSIDGQRGGAFSRQLLAVERPARLRLEVLGMLGQRVAVLATDGASYDLFRAESPGVETGDVHDEILWEVAGLPLTPAEAVRLALGAPLAPSARVDHASELAEQGGIRVELAGPPDASRVTLEFEVGGRLSRYLVRAPEGDAVLDAHYDDYREVDGMAFAHRIEVEFPFADTRAEIVFQWVELNPELPAELFRLQLSGADPSARTPVAPGPWSPSAS
jgi:hypothetical protein